MKKMRNVPGYLQLHRKGLLDKRVETGQRMLARCILCPRNCKVDRSKGALGACRVGAKARVASYGPHFGEEGVLVGTHGSGTIFFSGCNLHCVFCQNDDISTIDDEGDQAVDAVDAGQLAEIMLSLQKQGCLNINLVTPSHVVPQILQALPHAVELGLHLPLVYNSGGYDALHTLRLLDGVVDIYMPDCKFWSSEISGLYTEAPDYPEKMRKALVEMHRQVGDLVLDDRGIAVRGLLVRHLVMPGLLDETEKILGFLADSVSVDTYINIMDQYRPCAGAGEYEAIDRSLEAGEHRRAVQMAADAGLSRLDRRDWQRLLRMLMK